MQIDLNTTDISSIPFCKECKHYRRDWSGVFFDWGHRFGKCGRPQNTPEEVELNLLSGKIIQNKKGLPHAEIERKFDLKDHCGLEGKFFEPKTPAGLVKLLKRKNF